MDEPRTYTSEEIEAIVDAPLQSEIHHHGLRFLGGVVFVAVLCLLMAIFPKLESWIGVRPLAILMLGALVSLGYVFFLWIKKTRRKAADYAWQKRRRQNQ